MANRYETDLAYREQLYKIHFWRHKEHWGRSYDVSQAPWPKTDKEWRQTPYGAPWDSNVHMAEWHLRFARLLCKEDLLL